MRSEKGRKKKRRRLRFDAEALVRAFIFLSRALKPPLGIELDAISSLEESKRPAEGTSGRIARPIDRVSYFFCFAPPIDRKTPCSSSPLSSFPLTDHAAESSLGPFLVVSRVVVAARDAHVLALGEHHVLQVEAPERETLGLALVEALLGRRQRRERRAVAAAVAAASSSSAAGGEACRRHASFLFFSVKAPGACERERSRLTRSGAFSVLSVKREGEREREKRKDFLRSEREKWGSERARDFDVTNIIFFPPASTREEEEEGVLRDGRGVLALSLYLSLYLFQISTSS